MFYFNRTILCMVIALSLFMVSCSSKPSALQVKSDLQNRLDTRYPGVCKITSFKKLKFLGGDGGYHVMYFKFRAEILKDTDGFWCMKNVGCDHITTAFMYFSGSPYDYFKWTKTTVPVPRYNRLEPDPCKRYLCDIKKGDRFEVTQNVGYYKTNKGWVFDRFGVR